jgi:capsid protein
VLASLTHLRRRVGAFIGGFEAGLANRRLRGFQPSRAHLNTLIAAAGPDITARARWLVRNNGYAANAIESWAGNVVGAGIKPSSMISDSSLKAQVQKLWLDWTDEADTEGSRTSMACSAVPRAKCPSPARCSSGSGRAGRKTGLRCRCSCR